MADHRPGCRRAAFVRSGCVAPSATSTLPPVRSSHGLDTEDLPDKVIYLPCGDRRASVCPPCAETYRADTYQLIRAGLAGGKGMPESLAGAPVRVRHLHRAFLRPGSHSRRSPAEGPSPGADRDVRPASARTGGASPAGSGIKRPMPAWVGRCARTATTIQRPSCGTPTPPSCGGAPSSPSAAAWTNSQRLHGTRVRLSYAKVAEFQRRGLIHFHAVFRLDGHDPAHPEQTVPPHPAFTAEVLS